MIYCVWYPSGGFGHFVNAVLTLHGQNFVRPKKSLQFSTTGDSHALDLVVPKYFKNRWCSNFDFSKTQNYCVLIDNGINDESDQFRQTFPDATVIKICYSNHSWPIVARTMIDKAMQSDITKQLPIDSWHTDEDWAKREKYFLYLRDHAVRHSWRHSTDFALYVDDLLHYQSLFDQLNSVIKVEPFENLWHAWRRANTQYLDPMVTASSVIDSINKRKYFDTTGITDIWTQAVIYYYIWIAFGVEIPHNDYADFFCSTEQIAKLIA
jgi:hypothetical protein